MSEVDDIREKAEIDQALAEAIELEKAEIDQALAEAIELGRIRIVAKNEGDDDLMELTAKGVVCVAIIIITAMIDQSDKEKRDFNTPERLEIASHIETMLQALAKN